MANGNDESKVTKIVKAFQLILASIVVILTFLMFFALLFRQVTDASKDVVLFILGSTTTIITQIISYYFGSSKGSDDKTKIIGEMSSAAINQVANPTSLSPVVTMFPPAPAAASPSVDVKDKLING